MLHSTSTQYSVGGSNTCTACSLGMYNYGKGSSTCFTCIPGSIPNGSMCTACEKGKHAKFGDTSCSTCSGEGQYSDTEGAAVCEIAPSGTKPSPDRTGVRNCAAGTYSVGGTTTCAPCESGKYSAEGAFGCTSASTCGAGTRIKTASTATTDTVCEDCSIGQASMGGQATTCTECNNSGQYSDEPLSAACKIAPAGHKPKIYRDGIEECPKNTFSIGASDVCTDCTGGGHSKPGSSACEKCSSGKYYEEVENICELCPKNTFSISGASDASGCTPCFDGGYSKPGSGFCEYCLTGKYYDEVDISCKPCPKNTFSTSGAANLAGCAPCANIDTYAPSGSGYCLSCSSGTYYDEPLNTCLDCPSGTFTATGGVGIFDCEQCQEGFYSAQPGAPTCFACEAGKYAEKEQTKCLECPSGKISGVASSSCIVCEQGKFADGKGSVECIFCDNEDVLKGSTTASNGTTSARGCICPSGKYEDHRTRTCETVPEGVKNYVGGMNITMIQLKEGYWRTDASR